MGSSSYIGRLAAQLCVDSKDDLQHLNEEGGARLI